MVAVVSLCDDRVIIIKRMNGWICGWQSSMATQSCSENHKQAAYNITNVYSQGFLFFLPKGTNANKIHTHTAPFSFSLHQQQQQMIQFNREKRLTNGEIKIEKQNKQELTIFTFVASATNVAWFIGKKQRLDAGLKRRRKKNVSQWWRKTLSNFSDKNKPRVKKKNHVKWIFMSNFLLLFFSSWSVSRKISPIISLLLVKNLSSKPPTSPRSELKFLRKVFHARLFACRFT